MTHLPSLINDMATITVLASLVSFVFKKFNQPIALGYILVGFFVSPHFPLLPTITDESSIKVWAELGVIFLLFSLGLEFSFKRLLKLGATPLIIGTIEILGMILLGYGLGSAAGLSQTESLFMAAMVSISSTTIILKTFEERRLKIKNFAGLVISILIVEDLAAVLLIVLLTSLSVSKSIEASVLANTLLQLTLFLIVWFVSGFIVLPSIIKKVKSFFNDELILILSVALCLFATLLASHIGFSPSLGAFLMGSLLAETSLAHKIEGLTSSLKNLFGAIFFVSIGILINPAYIVENWGLILKLALLVILGKFTLISLGALVAGRDLKTSIQTSLSMTQIGEFSFIFASLGVTLKSIDPKLYPVAVSTSAITIFTTPLFIKFSPKIVDLFYRITPPKILNRLSQYSSSSEIVRQSSEIRKTIFSFFVFVVIHVAFILSIELLIKSLAVRFSSHQVFKEYRFILYFISLIFTLPFYWAIYALPHDRYLKNLLTKKSLKPQYYFLRTLTVCLLMILSLVQLELYFTKSWIVFFVWAGYWGMFQIRGTIFHKNYSLLENRFYKNFFHDPLESYRKVFIPEVSEPWGIQLVSINVPDYFSESGKTLEELKVRERYGVSVATITRGHTIIHTPMRWERVFANDQLTVIGTEEQLSRLSNFLYSSSYIHHEDQNSAMELISVVIQEDSSLAGVTIRDSKIREISQGLVVGIERQGQRIVNPDSTFKISVGDLIWLATEKSKIKMIRELATVSVQHGS